MQEDIFLLNLQNKTEFSSVLGNISQNKSPLLINGLLSSQRAHIAHYLSANLEKKLVLVTSNEIEAERIYTDLEFYNPDRVLFIKNEETRFYAYLQSNDPQKFFQCQKLGHHYWICLNHQKVA